MMMKLVFSLSNIFRNQVCRFRQVRSINTLSNEDIYNLDDDIFDERETSEYLDILKPINGRDGHILGFFNKFNPLEGHNVVVIQPCSMSQKTPAYNPNIQLQECVSLCKTLQNWNVIGKKILYGRTFAKKHLVGPESFEKLRELILSYKGVDAVFFGVEMLSGIQLATIESELRMPVYDRFTVVLNIFKQYAKSGESKIQVALAELPYVTARLQEVQMSSELFTNVEAGVTNLIRNVGGQTIEKKLNLLKRRESKLRNSIAKIGQHIERTKRQQMNAGIPIVSVVGYTNCGKTSLIKYLTSDEKLVPKDQLFATLDVSSHLGHLPSVKSVIYMDTIGFISRIPNLLLNAFSVTLKQIEHSDLLIHLIDVSHPDHRIQFETVVDSLKALDIKQSLIKNMLTVGNKVDLINSDDIGSKVSSKLPKSTIYVSVTKPLKMNELVTNLDTLVRRRLKSSLYILRVENGGKKYMWLRKYTSMLSCTPDVNDANFLICQVEMPKSLAGRWNKLFDDSAVEIATDEVGSSNDE